MAVKDCYSDGGRLASKRDMVELIVSGLPNGSGSWLWTSDMTSYTNAAVVKWSGDASATFADTPGTQASDYVRNTAANKLNYRCVWTNELRAQ